MLGGREGGSHRTTKNVVLQGTVTKTLVPQDTATKTVALQGTAKKTVVLQGTAINTVVLQDTVRNTVVSVLEERYPVSPSAVLTAPPSLQIFRLIVFSCWLRKALPTDRNG